MSILPKADEVIIPIEKFTKYALDPINSRGKWIAFNNALGYSLDNADMLIMNIKQNIKKFPARNKGNKGYGNTYDVLMELTGPNGKRANIMTAWLDDMEKKEMRLTSAYVKKRKGDKND